MKKLCWHRWEYLGDHYLLDKNQFSGGQDYTGYPVRLCRRCNTFQYKVLTLFWRGCEIVTCHGEFSTETLLAESGFREGKGLLGKLPADGKYILNLRPVGVTK